MKKYKCKICGYKFRLPKITMEEEFNIECKCFVYKDVLCPKCNHAGIINYNSIIVWLILGGVALFFIIFFITDIEGFINFFKPD